ncbi:UNVERIFIED_CONTAM: hypothetical protein Slati_1484800 [Sesamum latifolium]|uniref:Retrotransposon Copia-like N-terminal domain-containing protein n=1 Tax=Sesamum latifolium TaxID=2727402 RepID=A0AAW2X588_9LAMI
MAEVAKATSSKGEKPPHYQLSSSDRPGDHLVTHPLKGTNYLTWRRAVTNALISKHKMVYVDGRLPKPPQGDPYEETWITCNLMDLTTKRVIGTGKLKGDLYYFESKDEAKIHVAKTNMRMEILHQRLGHIPNKRLRSIFGDTILEYESRPCDACHKAKQCQNIFPVRDNKSKNIFDLVHLDTWGPYSSKTHDGYSYFLTIVDDCSREYLGIYDEN